MKITKATKVEHGEFKPPLLVIFMPFMVVRAILGLSE
jgi:hypothetical protein